MRWLMLSYRAPRQPSTARAAAWRLLKSAGALYLQQSVCVLPDRPGTREVVARVRAFIERADGSATLLEIGRLAASSERLLRERFTALRDEEYGELLERCEAFLEELRRETARGKLTFAEVEENDDDLVKLRAWLRKIRSRDFFGSTRARAAEAKVRRCEARLHAFSERVLAREGGEVRTRSRSPRARRARGSAATA